MSAPVLAWRLIYWPDRVFNQATRSPWLPVKTSKCLDDCGGYARMLGVVLIGFGTWRLERAFVFHPKHPIPHPTAQTSSSLSLTRSFPCFTPSNPTLYASRSFDIPTSSINFDRPDQEDRPDRLFKRKAYITALPYILSHHPRYTVHNINPFSHFPWNASSQIQSITPYPILSCTNPSKMPCPSTRYKYTKTRQKLWIQTSLMSACHNVRHRR